MDYTDSGFKAGFAHGMHVCLTAMLFRPFRHEPWPSRPCRPCATIWKRTAAPV